MYTCTGGINCLKSISIGGVLYDFISYLTFFYCKAKEHGKVDWLMNRLNEPEGH